jgi:hypothetical protein
LVLWVAWGLRTEKPGRSAGYQSIVDGGDQKVNALGAKSQKHLMAAKRAYFPSLSTLASVRR